MFGLKHRIVKKYKELQKDGWTITVFYLKPVTLDVFLFGGDN